jgi:hypothetical protein
MKIYSIFGHIDAAAAEHFISARKAVRIDPADIPDEEKRHPLTGEPAKFAVMVPTPYVADFEELCSEVISA